MPEPVMFGLLAAGGVLAGIMNAMAGGGSFITYPLLLIAGLSPQMANATNRIGLVVQCVAGSATYHRHRVMPWRALMPLWIPGIAGAAIGAGAAAHLSESLFRHITAALLILATASIFLRPDRWSRERPGEGRVRPVHYLGVFAMAVYGGFLQIALGPLILSFFVIACGFDVIRSNALKFGLVGVYQIMALLVFTRADQVSWPHGIALAAGTMIGGGLGARLVVSQGTRWVRYVVALAALLAVVKLLSGG